MIKYEQFLLRQPSFPKKGETDKFFLGVANELTEIWKKSGLLPSSEALIDRVALCLIGYYQDIIIDAGLWRSFITEHRRLYKGRTLPFYDVTEGYMDSELNKEDVLFMTWYSIAMFDESRRDLYPFDEDLVKLGTLLYEELERKYDEAPLPSDFNPAFELELHDPEDFEKISNLGHWLFMHSYLLTPAFSLTLSQIVSNQELLKPENGHLLQERLEQAMAEEPTGPLALYLHEWITLMLTGKMPRPHHHKPEDDETEKPIHPYYDAFTKATGGETIKFIGSYKELNDFFVNVLGWKEGEEHMPQFKNEHDFVLMVEKNKGMLIARNVCRCIKSPLNPYYDADYAKQHAFDLLTVRGLCPHDLMVRIFEEKWLPDAAFPGSDDAALVARNADFIARCYLQLYYRGD